MDTKKLIVGCLAAAGMTLALGAASPAMADDDWDGGGWDNGGWHDNGWHNGHHKHKHKHRRNYNNYYQGGYYYAPPPVYYAPPPVYYAPPPVYYPQRHYRRPSVSIIFPFNFD